MRVANFVVFSFFIAFFWFGFLEWIGWFSLEVLPCVVKNTVFLDSCLEPRFVQPSEPSESIQLVFSFGGDLWPEHQ